jgi:hypothetical protein
MLTFTKPSQADKTPAATIVAAPQRGFAVQSKAEDRSPSGAGHHFSQMAIDAVNAPESGGSALPQPALAKMENAFGHDFSDVRVHESDAAAGIGALAYTRGDSIHFAPGRYQPESSQGQQLLGHELTHVVQQRQGRVSAAGAEGGVPINDDPSLEREADESGARAARGETAGSAPASAAASEGGLQMKTEEEETAPAPAPATAGPAPEEEMK